MTKLCTRCEQDKPLSEMMKRASSPDGHGSWCKNCLKEYSADKFQTDPAMRARKRANRDRLHERNRQMLWEYLLAHPCIDCGISDPRVLEFDHRDDVTKEYNISDTLHRMGWQSVLREIEKCDVRCANCHRIRTQEQFGTWRFTRLDTVPIEV